MTPSPSDRRKIRDRATLRDTLVLALGNLLRGDDGAGPAIVDLLAGNLPSYVVVEDGGTPGLTTVLLMHGYHRVIIVDAADMGLEPGLWKRFGVGALSTGDLHQIGALHDADLAKALKLGRALGVLPADIVIYGIQPAATGRETGLSDPVQQAVQSIAHEIAGEVS
jgi:hydrogenase maturation protease